MSLADFIDSHGDWFPISGIAKKLIQHVEQRVTNDYATVPLNYFVSNGRQIGYIGSKHLVGGSEISITTDNG